jgi:5-formyltetrahydrofolate cyclo-ligase
MNTGFGFSEMLLIVGLIVVFFGSKELPALLRQIARFTAQMRRYSDRIRRELDEVARSTEPQVVPFAEQQAKKKELRSLYLSARSKLSQAEREEKSAAVMTALLELDVVKNSSMIMLYADMGAEVRTRSAISELLARGKRVVLPYCVNTSGEMSAAEIKSADTDIVIGSHNVPEPRPELRGKFFRSDLDVIVVPGVAFDLQGGRLGRGRGYYDTFLHDLRGKVPIIGVAFECQILTENLPFEYHDVPMTMVITERGIVFGAPVAGSQQYPALSPAG